MEYHWIGRINTTISWNFRGSFHRSLGKSTTKSFQVLRSGIPTCGISFIPQHYIARQFSIPVSSALYSTSMLEQLSQAAKSRPLQHGFPVRHPFNGRCGLYCSCTSLSFAVPASTTIDTPVESQYVVYLASVMLYNILFHPVRHFPGPNI